MSDSIPYVCATSRGSAAISISCYPRVTFIGPILWGHSGPLCHALSLLLSLSLSSLWTSMRRRRATVQWRHLVNGVRRLVVANGSNIFQMLLVILYYFLRPRQKNVEIFTVYLPRAVSLDGHLCLSNSPPFNLHLLYFLFVLYLLF